MELPIVLKAVQLAPFKRELVLDIQPGLRCFAGHFPEAPVLAGVVQIDWVMHYARKYYFAALIFRGMQSIKFLNLLRPPACVTLTLEAFPERGLIKFSYLDEQLRYSSGGIKVEPWVAAGADTGELRP